MRAFEFLVQSIPVLISLYAQKYKQDDLYLTMNELENEWNVPKIREYDFIVVGGGSAGCIVASRLSENFNVLLLEAGGFPPPASANNFFSTRVAADPDINYFFKSVPQEYGGVLTTHTGKMLGGSGSHNDVVHNRGSPMDYDNYAAIAEDPSFSYLNMIPYFKKMENFIGRKYGEGDDEYYGNTGLITVDTNVVPLVPLWLKAGEELGFETADPNGFQRESFTPLNKAIGKDGIRSSSYTAYIKPHLGVRESLTVVKYANVSEILIDENKKAYGVAYTRHDFPQIAYATKEIILSAGAYSSPLLLMKSGVGPSDVLIEAGITVKHELPSVGQNLQEHPSLYISDFYLDDSSDPFLFPRINTEDTEQIIKDFHNGTGLFTLLWEGPQCFVVSSKAESGWPDLWVIISPTLRVTDEPQTATFYIVLGRPQSRGFVSLNSTAYLAGRRDDVDLAVIDFKFFSNPDDLDVLIEGIKLSFKIAEETTPFQGLNTTFRGKQDPECLEYEFKSEDYWKCVIQKRAQAWIHMVGTNSIGTSPTNSVLDSKFRVHGIEGLRVVDASAIPTVPNANLNAPVMVFAEKASDEIIKSWK